MRIDVKKYLVLGPASLKERFFQRVQEEGIVEFVAEGPLSAEVPAEIQTYRDAFHVLRTMVPVKQVRYDQDYRAPIAIARDLVETKEQLEKRQEQVRLLEQEIARVAPFGDFSMPDFKEIEKESGRHLQFYFRKAASNVPAPESDNLIKVGSAYGLDYYLGIHTEPTTYPSLIEMTIERPLGELQEELAFVHREIDALETDIARLAYHKKTLRQGLIEALNHHHLDLALATSDSFLEGEVFATQGWVPKNKEADLLKLADELQLHISPVAVEKEDRVPTYLENAGPARLGEDLIGIYDTPSTSDRDPSLWVFISFAIFFSMIIADAGYGLLLLGIALFLRFKFPNKGALFRRFTRLVTWLAGGCIVWGILTTSFVGIDFPPDSPLRKVSLTKWVVEKKADYLLAHKGPSYDELVKDYPQIAKATSGEQMILSVKKGEKYPIFDTFSDNFMIELALFIGTIHIILSFLRYLDRHWAGIGWIIFMVGSYLFFPSILKALSLIHYLFGIPPVAGAEVGKYLLYAGLGLAALLALIQHRLGGIAEITNVIGVFADVMSYLRIYALSLAGMIMASTFDKIGLEAPLYIGIFIIIAGHTVNFTLAMMSGIIHGLRLNFIEWYHYSFEGGGRPFAPLSLLKQQE